VSFRFRSSQQSVPHNHANFGIGTLVRFFEKRFPLSRMML
jgi:hypothetical protein